MSARPFQVGDPVLIDGTPGKVWLIDGPNLDDKFNGDFATAYIQYDELNEAGRDGTAVIMTPDLTASKYPQRTIVLRTAGDSTEVPASEPIYLTLDGATIKRHTTDPDLEDLRDAGWAEIDDDGTVAESMAEVSVPTAAFVLNQRVEVVEPEHPLFGRQGRVYRAKPDSLGRIRVDIDRAPDGMHDGWHAIEAWCLAPLDATAPAAFPDVLVHGRAIAS